MLHSVPATIITSDWRGDARGAARLYRQISLRRDDPRAAIAAYTLGRLEMDQLNRPSRARAAFARGAGVLGIGDVLMLPPERATAQHLEEPIGALRRVSPLGKRNLVTACAQVAADDGYLDPDEVDLVRALAELWDCPVPLQRATA